MIMLVIQVFMLFAAAICSGSFTALFMFSIGSPDREFNKTRILSRVGAYMLDKYNEWDDRTQELADGVHMEVMQMISADQLMEDPELMDLITYKADKAAKRVWLRRPNPWKAIGVCGYCAGTWHGLITAAIFYWKFELSVVTLIFVPPLAVVFYAMTKRKM